MQVQQVSNQNFGALNCRPNLDKILLHIASNVSSTDAAIRGDKYLAKLDKNKAVTDIYLTNSNKKRLCAKVGDKIFKENIFFGPLTVLKKALKISEKLELQK